MFFKSRWFKVFLVVTLIPCNVHARIKNQLWKNPVEFSAPEHCDQAQLENRVRECNIATDTCAVCGILALAVAMSTAWFTFGASFAGVGVACAAPCGIAQGMCDHMQSERHTYNNCLHHNSNYATWKADAMQGKTQTEALWLPKMADEVSRHENAVEIIKKYPELVLQELYKKLKQEQIDTDSEEAKAFIDVHTAEVKKIIDEKMQEERVRFFRFYTEGFGEIYYSFQMEDPWQEFIDECQRTETEPGLQFGRECFLQTCVDKGYFEHEKLYPAPPYHPRLLRCSEGMIN